MKKDELVRKNIRMSGYIADWYEERAKKLGVSQTNLFVMALNEYIKQDQAMNMMANFEYVMQELEDLKSQTEK